MSSFLSGGVSIRLDATEPPGAGPFPALLLLHGAGGNTDFWLDRIAPSLTQLGVALYAVHYFDRTKTVRADITTLTDGRHVPLWLDTLRDAVAYIATRPKIDANRIALVGISLGGYLSLALAAEACQALIAQTVRRMPIRAIVEISGGLPEPWATQASSAFPPTLTLHGDRDTVVPVAEAHAIDRRLTALGITHQIEILPGEGHWFSPGAQLRILTAVASFLGHHLAR